MGAQFAPPTVFQSSGFQSAFWIVCTCASVAGGRPPAGWFSRTERSRFGIVSAMAASGVSAAPVDVFTPFAPPRAANT